jgi:hypothetical protein
MIEVIGVLSIFVSATAAISAIPAGVYYFVNRRRIVGFDWPWIIGEIFSGQIDTRASRTTHICVDILYWYKINERFYSGQWSRPCWREQYYSQELEKLLKKYHRGAVVKVHYKPTDPAVSALEPIEFSFFRNWLITFAVVLALELIVLSRMQL